MTGELEQEGVMVNAVIPPAVPRNASLIRISMMADLSRHDLEMALDKFQLVGKRVGLL